MSRFICIHRRRGKDHNKIKVWDASLDRQPKIQSSSVEETLRIMEQTNNDCRFRISTLTSSRHQQLLFAGRWGVKTEVCTCSQFPAEAMQWIKEVEMVDSVDELRSSSSTRGISMPNFEVLDAKIASALNEIIHNSHFKRRISLKEQKVQKEGRFLRGRQIAYLIYDHFRVTGSHDSVKNHNDLFTVVLRSDDIKEFDSKWDGISLSMTKIPHDDILEGLYKLRIRLWEIQDRIGIVRLGDSSEEVRTWLTKIENYGEEKYRARNSK